MNIKYKTLTLYFVIVCREKGKFVSLTMANFALPKWH